MTTFNRTQITWHSVGDKIGAYVVIKPRRSLVIFLLLCGGLAWVLAPSSAVYAQVTELTSGTTRPRSEPSKQRLDSPPKVAANVQAQASTPLEEGKGLPERIDKLEERERQLYALSLEASRKTIDWWFSFLAVLTALVGIAGAFLPWLMGRKDKELIEAELKNARDLVASITDMRSDAEVQMVKIKSYTEDQTPEQKQQTREEAQNVVNNPASTKFDRLYARAVLAGQGNKKTLAQAHEACKLWYALKIADPGDARAAFNYAFWLQLETAMKDAKSQSVSLLERQSLVQAYVQAHSLDLSGRFTGMYQNWGAALNKEANAWIAQDAIKDLPKARELWKLAGEKFARALEIKSDDDTAALNWGIALKNEAQALRSSDPQQAQTLLNQAVIHLERARRSATSDAVNQRVADMLAEVNALKNAGA